MSYEYASKYNRGIIFYNNRAVWQSLKTGIPAPCFIYRNEICCNKNYVEYYIRYITNFSAEAADMLWLLIYLICYAAWIKYFYLTLLIR